MSRKYFEWKRTVADMSVMIQNVSSAIFRIGAFDQKVPFNAVES